MSEIKISAIVAAAENNAIGRGNDLLWHIPADFKHFKKVTMSKPIIMGRKTFESLPGVLPGRVHIVVSRSGFSHGDVLTVVSLEEGIARAKGLALDGGQDEVFIIGGAQIYEQALLLVDRLYLTRVHQEYEGDAFFPALNMNEWRLVSEEPHEGDPAFTIMVLERQASVLTLNTNTHE